MKRFFSRLRPSFDRLFFLWLLVFPQVFLLWIPKDGYLSIADAKLRALFAGCLLLTLFLMYRITAMLKRHYRAGTMPRLRHLSPLQTAALGYWISVLLSALLSHYPEQAWSAEGAYSSAVVQSLYLFCFFCVSAWGRARKELLWSMAVWLPFSVICILQLCGGNPLGLFPGGLEYKDAYTQYNGQFIGTVGNVGLVSCIFCLAVPICLVSLWKGRGRLRFLLLIPVICILVIQCAIRVDSGFVGLGLGAILTVCILSNVSRTKKRIAYACLISAAVCAAVLLWFADPGIRLLHELHEILHGRIDNSFGTGRVFIWRQLLKYAPDHPVFGAGPGTMLFSARKIVGIGKTESLGIFDAHNIYLHVFFEQGVVGLVFFLSITAHWLIPWIRRHGKSTALSALGAGLLCCTICMLFSVSAVPAAPFFWIVLGLFDAEDSRIRHQG